MKYCTPDERWEIFGASCFEMYLEKYVIISKFHLMVPKDILEGYKTAEYMMCFAYYHYPIYDEALSKVLKLIELAVKLRCKDFGISTKGDVKLNKLINELSKRIPSVKVNMRLHAARRIRNYLMHPSQNNYAGGILRASMVALANLINEIFLPPNFFIDTKKEVERIKDLLIPFDNGTYVLERDNKRFLIYKVKCFEAIPHNNVWNYFLVCYPVLKDVYQEIVEHKISGVIKLVVKDINIENNIITAINKDDEQFIRISINNNPTNVTSLENYSHQLSKYSADTLMLYETIIQDLIDREISEFNYNNYKSIDYTNLL
ncbi:MAG: hypothetical protein MUE96_01855 [Bacteroidia bacterium]|jgi:hypothetical protein|nr:hypothetical protein [Bacteroidia bacterium]